MNDESGGGDKFCVKANIDMWKNRVGALTKIDEYTSDGTGALLCCCYIEAIGRFLLYDEYKSSGTLEALENLKKSNYKIYVGILKKYSGKEEYSKNNTAALVYKEFRCDFVHAGQEPKGMTINEKTGESIDFYFLKETLENIFSLFKEKYENKKLEEITEVYDFFTLKKS